MVEFTSPICAQNLPVFSRARLEAGTGLRIAIVRGGSARLHMGSSESILRRGDIIVLTAGGFCHVEPETEMTLTTLDLSRDYIQAQLRWKLESDTTPSQKDLHLEHRLETPTSHSFRMGGHRTDALIAWLDDLVLLGLNERQDNSFFRAQALSSTVLHTLDPFLTDLLPGVRRDDHLAMQTGAPWHTRLLRDRSEVSAAIDLLKKDLSRRWTLDLLASKVHLSRSRLSAIFTAAHGKTPHEYLNMLRVEEMGNLLLHTEMTTGEIGRRVGWQSRSHAAQMFRRRTGLSPREYRLKIRPSAK